MIARDVRKIVKQACTEAFTRLPDKAAVSLYYLYRMGRLPNLKNPALFTELIQAQKLSNRSELLPKVVDKIAVKDYVRSRLGPDWITETLWHGTDLRQFDRSKLKTRAVLKSTHGSGHVAFLDPSSEIDWERLIERTDQWMATRYGNYKREWAYSRVDPLLLIESDIGGVDGPPSDFKFYTFRDRVEFVQVDTTRFTDHRLDFFDRDWNPLDFQYVYPRSDSPPAKPDNLEVMIEAAEKLGKPFDFVRVDFYNLASGPRFGEMTLYPGSGAEKFNPPIWDRRFGETWLRLASRRDT